MSDSAIKPFLSLLDRYVDTPAPDRSPVEAEIWQDFGVQKAVFALDMSGFSLTVRRAGIIGYLGQIRRMLRIGIPLVKANEGEIVKTEADNILALFPDVAQAVKAAEEIHAALAAERKANPSPLPLAASVGIDFGKLLSIPGCDCFGDPVNIAFKLGEDLAAANEILITDNARLRLPAETAERFSAAEFSLSGLSLHAWRLSCDPATA